MSPLPRPQQQIVCSKKSGSFPLVFNYGNYLAGPGRELPDEEGDDLCVAPPPPGALQGGRPLGHEDQQHLQVHRVQV